MKTISLEKIQYLLQKITKYRQVVLALSAAVVFITTYLLILPALTLDEETASTQGGIDVPQVQEEEADVSPDLLTFEGQGFDVSAECGAAALPTDTQLVAEEIPEGTEEFEGYREEALRAVQEKDGKKKAAEFGFVRLYDISLYSEGAAIEPNAPVDVTISYDKPVKAGDADHARIVHFGVNKKGEPQTEVLDPEDVSVSMKKDKLQEASFTAESFSVYAVVYTVDFHYDVNGEQYKVSLPGGGFVSFQQLAELLNMAGNTGYDVSEEEKAAEAADEERTKAADDLSEVEVSDATREFVAEVSNVEFSDPDLVWVGKIEGDRTVHEIREENSLDAEYSKDLTQAEIDAVNNTIVRDGDWAILSLKSFDSEETLTVTMKNGDSFIIRVTDEKNAVMNEDGTVQTIANPSGTTIDLFDYWIDSETEVARRAWPGYSRNGTTGSESDFWNYFTNTDLNTNGNNIGINYGHKLKFVPSMSQQVQEYLISTGNSNGVTQDGNVTDGINGWNGRYDDYNNRNVYNGYPTQGIVAGALENGYPRLNLNNGNGNASNRESLDYLFNPDTNHSGKRSYSDVNGLFYVDPDGYYTYESMDYKAKLEADKTFTLTEQPGAATTEGQIGFWPMGDLNYWLGMHMQVDFSTPANGEVLNPQGKYMPMKFEFAGDDDAWVYIDGILIADGGGIHNRTEIDIDFKTGHSVVKGGEYTNILRPNTTVVSDKTIYEIFTEAHQNGLISDEKWASDYTNNPTKTVWIDADGDGELDTFAPGTYHTFDFFYLERGGGESNLYIHYNLVSTTDFSAHKSYYGEDNPSTQDVDESRLRRDQFKFELIGFDNPAYASEGEEFVHAIMPDNGTPSGEETVASPKKVHKESAPEGLEFPDNLNLTAHTSLITGVTEDGNVNFGDIQIQDSQVGKQYYYAVREIVPDDAVNADGVRWDKADPEQKAEGGFVLDNITYDGKVYYFIGEVVETEEGVYELKKRRKTDATYEETDSVTKFFSFVNGLTEPLTLQLIKTSDIGNKPLDGAQFALTRARLNVTEDDEGTVISRKWEAKPGAESKTGTTSGGKLDFSNLMEGHYILEETAAPSGYEKGDISKWLLTITKVEAEDHIELVPTITPLYDDGSVAGPESDSLDVDGDNTFQYNVLNGKIPLDISVEKQWFDNGDSTPPNGASATFALHRIKNESPVKVELLDYNGDKISEVEAFAGDVIKIYDSGEKAFQFHYDVPSNIAIWFDNTRTRDDSISPNDGSWILRTDYTYSVSSWNPIDPAQLVSSTSTSSGQYTVDEQDIEDGKVQLRLNRYTKNYFDKLPVLYNATNSNAGSIDEVYETFTLPQDGDGGNSWKKTYTNLPQLDERGNEYRYYIVETAHTPDNYDRLAIAGDPGSADNPLNASSDVIFTNSTAELPKITAAKVWKDSIGNPIDSASGLDGLEVKLTLYKGNNPAPAGEVKDGAEKITQTVIGDGTATWFLLDEHADVTQYSVRETAVKIPGGDFIDTTSENPFGGSVTGNSTNGYTVTNQLPETEISVTKQWKDGTSVNADKVFDEAKTISFVLYQKAGSNEGAPYTVNGQVVTGTVTYTPASGGAAASWSTEEISDLPKYVYHNGSWYEAAYYPVEDPAIDGVKVTYQKTGGNASETPSDAAAGSGTVTITNTDIVYPIKIIKVIKDTETALGGATFTLTLVDENRNIIPDKNGDPITQTGTTDDTAGELVFEGLLPGAWYQLEETDRPAGYISEEGPYYIHISAEDGTGSLDTTVAHELISPESGNEFTIENTPGPILPCTGGPGPGLYTFIGSILVLFAGALLVRRRKLI